MDVSVTVACTLTSTSISGSSPSGSFTIMSHPTGGMTGMVRVVYSHLDKLFSSCHTNRVFVFMLCSCCVNCVKCNWFARVCQPVLAIVCNMSHCAVSSKELHCAVSKAGRPLGLYSRFWHKKIRNQTCFEIVFSVTYFFVLGRFRDLESQLVKKGCTVATFVVACCAVRRVCVTVACYLGSAVLVWPVLILQLVVYHLLGLSMNVYRASQFLLIGSRRPNSTKVGSWY